MAISMVRKPSETPNITNIDDIIPFRYAYGNQNGYVISRGAEVSYTVNGNQFTVNSGRLVIQGVESDIDANGITLTIDSVSETRYYAVYLEVNLATNTSNIKVEFDTSNYPNITEGDDLTANSSGIARLVLYNFIAQNGVISGVNKVVKAIDYTGTALVGYDTSKGTVEERLDKLGFKTGLITLKDGVTEIIKPNTNVVTRQGNYVIGTFIFNILTNDKYANNLSIGTMPEEFKPAKSITFGIAKAYSTSAVTGYADCYNAFTINEDGSIILTLGGQNMTTQDRSVTVNFGYEANPL